jgi:hypothetical protein
LPRNGKPLEPLKLCTNGRRSWPARCRPNNSSHIVPAIAGDPVLCREISGLRICVGVASVGYRRRLLDTIVALGNVPATEGAPGPQLPLLRPSRAS